MDKDEDGQYKTTTVMIDSPKNQVEHQATVNDDGSKTLLLADTSSVHNSRGKVKTGNILKETGHERH